MAISFVRNIISSGYNLFKINDNFQKIQTALQNALSRDGLAPNEMEADLDLNSNDLLNVNVLNVETIVLDGEVVVVDDLATLPDDVMLKSVYDVDEKEVDVYSTVSHTYN